MNTLTDSDWPDPDPIEIYEEMASARGGWSHVQGPPRQTPVPDESAPHQLRQLASALSVLAARLTGAAVEEAVAAARASAQRAKAAPEVPVLSMGPCPAGVTARGTIDVVHTGPGSGGTVELCCDGLLGPDAVILDSAAVELSPSRLHLAPGVGGGEVRVAIYSSPDTAPGRYVGIIRQRHEDLGSVVLILDIR